MRREDFEIDLKSYSEIYQPKKKWTIKAEVAQARRMRFGKYASMGPLSRSRFLREGYSPRRLGSGSTVWH